jgi:phosphoribosylformylglycinamidine synthase
MQLKDPGSALFFLGTLRDECGGSLYYDILEQMLHADRDALLGAHVPQPDFASVSREISFVTEATSKGLLAACHDVSDGGILTALFEMTLPQRKIGGTIGVNVDIAPLTGSLRTDTALFTQTGGFLMEAKGGYEGALERLAKTHDIPLTHIGETSSRPLLTVRSGTTTLIEEDIHVLRSLWENGLSEAWK